MRTLLLFSCILLVWCGEVMAQQKPVIDTVWYSGSTEKRINFVILADGYQEHEFGKFHTDTRTITNALFDAPPLRDYKPYFNVFAIAVASKQSGATHPGIASDEPLGTTHPVLQADTYFGSTFDYAGIHRLLVPTNTEAIMLVLAASIPDYDQAFVLVNSAFYGGSGGNIATASSNIFSAGVAYHEIGHSFVGLGDEYSIASSIGEHLNISYTTERALLPWQQWLTNTAPLPTPRTPDYYNTIGAFSRANDGSSNYGYIPTQDCKMQYVTSPFCAVCREHFIERIHDLTSPIDSITPSSTNIELFPNDTSTFVLHAVHPVPSTLRVVWALDGVPLTRNTDSLSLAMHQLSAGKHVLSAVVTDTTLHSRAARHLSEHSYLVQWHINKLATSVQVVSKQNSFHLTTTPNPFTETLTMRYELSRSAHIRMELLDLRGTPCAVLLDEQQPSGQHTCSSALYRYRLASGMYIVQTMLDGILVSHHLVQHQ